MTTASAGEKRSLASSQLRPPSFEPERALADAAERLRAVNPAACFHLEAPAGSGKTFLLTARFLRLLGCVDHPQSILALTFTNKAAGEMRDRIGRFLVRAARGEHPSDDLDASLLDAARKALDRHRRRRELLLSGDLLRIQTFHAFCYTLVSLAPLPSGVSPGSTLLGDPDQTIFLRRSIDDTLASLLSRRPEDPWRRALENRLLYLNNSWSHLVRELQDLMGRRESLRELTRVLDPPHAADARHLAMRDLVEAQLGVLRTAFLQSGLGRQWGAFVAHVTEAGAAAAEGLIDSVPGTAWEDLPDWQRMAEALLTQSGGPRKQCGPKAGFYSGFAKTVWFELLQGLDEAIARLLHEIRPFPAEEAEALDLEPLLDLILLLNAVMETYERRCREGRYLDFTSLERAALRLFDAVNPSDLQLFLDHQIQHVLVDEFQDTSLQQWELLQHLCAGWSMEDGRTLFVVGDPKQSIYGFRKAEVRLFLEARDGLPLSDGGGERLPMEPLVLRTNFRSAPALISWCNGLFERTVMADPDPLHDEVSFSPGTPPPQPLSKEIGPHAGSADAAPQLALFLEWPDGITARRREAAWLAGHLAARQAEGKREERSTGILLFTRTHLPAYLEALQGAGVAVQVTEGLKLAERPEVLALWQLARALVLPHDDLAWVTQLHSPWVRLGYTDILAVAKEESPAWVEKIRLAAAWHSNVARLWDGLADARQHTGRYPLGEVLEKAWLSLGGARIVAERWGSRGIASCRRFLDLVREAEVHEPVGTLKRLEQLMEEAFEPVDPETASSNVFLMTVHKAKGLEFDTVYLPFLDWNPEGRERRDPPPYILERVPGASHRHLLAVRPDRQRGMPDPVYKCLRDLQVGRRRGEAKRLFYVAVTRARQELFLSGILSKGRGKETSFGFARKSPLAWLEAHYGLKAELGLENGASDGETGECGGDGEDMSALTSFESSGASEVRKAIPASGMNEPKPLPYLWERGWENPAGDFRVIMEPGSPRALSPGDALPSRDVTVEPALFERERPLTIIRNPSELVRLKEPSQAPAAVPGDNPQVWGMIVHRLLECYGRERRLPAVEQVAALARYFGIMPERVITAASAALEEAAACVRDPWLAQFYAATGDEHSQEPLLVEWPIEARRGERVLDVGVVDLVAFREGRWWIIDFKTSRNAGEDLETFMREESALYRPQLSAYRHMWAERQGVSEKTVTAVLYWTAYRCGREISEQ